MGGAYYTTQFNMSRVLQARRREEEKRVDLPKVKNPFPSPSPTQKKKKIRPVPASMVGSGRVGSSRPGLPLHGSYGGKHLSESRKGEES